MSESFDPYHRWLGIAPEEQPANHYRLLGLKQFEADADVIESAADRQMAHVRSFQSGEYADEAQRVLNEISAAKLVLLKAEEKSAYDTQLKAKPDAPDKVREPKMAQALPLESASSAAPPPKRPVPKPTTAAVTPRKSVGPIIALFVAVPIVLFLALGGGAVAYLILGGDDETTARNETENDPAEVVTPPVVTTSNNPDSNPTVDETDPIPSDTVPPVDNPITEPPVIAEPEPPIPTPNVEPSEPDDTELVAQAPEVQIPIVTGPQKHAVPDKAARDAARAKIDTIFSLEDADTRAKKAAFVQQLLKVASDTKDDSVAQFVLLNMAREVAAENAQARLAMEAVDRLQAGFDFDTWPVRMATLGTAVKSPVAPTEKKEVLAVGIEMIDTLMVRDEYETAGKLAVAMLDIARRARERTLLDALIARRTRAAELLTAYRKAQSAISLLESDPDNADANLTVGKFYLFAKADWGRALPLLAKGSDRMFAAAASAEITKPNTTVEEHKLANTWWSLAEAQDDDVAKQLLQSRAMAWYQSAAPKLSGLDRAAAQQRIGQLADAGIRPLEVLLTADASTIKAGSRLPSRTWIDMLRWANALKGSPQPWSREGEEVITCGGTKGKELRLPVSVDGSYQLHIEATVETPSGIVLVIPVGSRRVNLSVGEAAWTLQWVNGGKRDRSLQVRNFTFGKRVAMTVTVRVSADGSQAEISYAINGEPVAAWSGNPASLSGWGGKDACPPTIGAWGSRIRYHSARFQLLEGRAVLHDDAALQVRARDDRVVLGEVPNDRPRVVTPPNDGQWIQLFNGRDLTGWKAKIKDHQLGDNHKNTFRVQDGVLRVAYDNYRTFDGKFGHLFYETPFSNYNLRVEYRFVGDLCDGAPKWAHRNSGVLIHSQSPESMEITQEFPASLEAQLVGGKGNEVRPTANLVTTGTHVVMNGRLHTTHSTKSASKTFHGDQWVTVEVEVRGGKSIKHIVNGEVVLQYAQPQLDSGKRLEGGYIALQAKGHPIEFRRVELKPLGTGVDVSIPQRTDGLIAHWTFDEGRGAIARDSAGGHHGTIKGGTWIRGIRGNALSFDGKDDVIEIPLADALNVRGRITLSAWVRARSLRTKRDQHNTFTSIIDQADKDGATFLRYIDRGEGPNYSTGAYQPGKHTHQALSKVNSTDVGQWVHLAGVYDGAAWRLYRNGREVASEETDLGARGRPVNWRIAGAFDPDRPFFFHGDLDDVRIYNRALSVEEVTRLAERAEAASAPNIRPGADRAALDRLIADQCIALYTFEKDTFERRDEKLTLLDQSGADTHGEVRNGAIAENGKTGAAFYFDGDNDVVIIPKLREKILGEPNLSIACWIRPETEDGGGAFFSVGAFAETTIDLRVPGGKRLGFLCSKHFGGGMLETPLSETPRWQHVVATVGKTEMQLYVDGKKVASAPAKIRTFDDRSLPNVAARLGTKGKARSAAVRRSSDYKGYIDELLVMGRVLSDEEVESLHNAGLNGVSLAK